MVKIKPIIKWTGSKRRQSEMIIEHFPKQINTYFEPFVGGGSVMFQLLHSDIKVNNIICSDINEDLIDLWNMIKNTPSHLIDEYERMWNEINSLEDVNERTNYYNSVRNRYNASHNVIDFYFLSRTSANGLIRYNSKGEFNAPYHKNRQGINPKSLRDIINDWSSKLNEHNVQFIHQSYENIQTVEGDFLYLDPPYVDVGGDVYYRDGFSHDEFWNWLRNQQGGYVLSFDGKLDEQDNTYAVPRDLYSKHHYLDNGISGFKKIHKDKSYGKESIYIK